jgi:hypothetical protein
VRGISCLSLDRYDISDEYVLRPEWRPRLWNGGIIGLAVENGLELTVVFLLFLPKFLCIRVIDVLKLILGEREVVGYQTEGSMVEVGGQGWSRTLGIGLHGENPVELGFRFGEKTTGFVVLKPLADSAAVGEVSMGYELVPALLDPVLVQVLLDKVGAATKEVSHYQGAN